MNRLVVGLMSGTSMDGIDAALLEIWGSGKSARFRPLAFATLAYPGKVRETLWEVCQGPTLRSDATKISALNSKLGELFARAALQVTRRARRSINKVDLIGSHGQTVYHNPKGVDASTLQLGEPAIIAERTGVTTVADFRPADLAAGGEGAPLTPYVHYLLFRDRKKSRAVHNLGGISNLTYIPAGGGLNDVVAFDTGPGNMVLDGICRWITKGGKRVDLNGSMARQGRVHEGLLEELLRHPYFHQRPPKSTGREAFGEPYVSSLCRRSRSRRIAPLDLLATATALTSRSIASSFRKFILPHFGKVDEIYFTGGGRKNRTLMGMLKKGLDFSRVGLVEELGFDGDALEAQAFAILANEAVAGVASNLCRVTGARHEVILGKIVPGRNYLGVKLSKLKSK